MKLPWVDRQLLNFFFLMLEKRKPWKALVVVAVKARNVHKTLKYLFGTFALEFRGKVNEKLVCLY